MTQIHTYTDELVSPIEALEHYLTKAGSSILQAAFKHSYFAHPARVQNRTPHNPSRARFSREHYPGLKKGDPAAWKGRKLKLDDNAAAQGAWAYYSSRPIQRGSGYGVRHVWGRPWDPDAFTAGWNLNYMPFWAGMLTEKQHSHPELEQAIRQAAWNRYFRDDPVCTPPEFVTDPALSSMPCFSGSRS